MEKCKTCGTGISLKSIEEIEQELCTWLIGKIISVEPTRPDSQEMACTVKRAAPHGEAFLLSGYDAQGQSNEIDICLFLNVFKATGMSGYGGWIGDVKINGKDFHKTLQGRCFEYYCRSFHQ